MSDLDLFNVFVTVAKHKNFTRASEQLFISQPAVSNSIKTLENSLGGKLFERKKNGVELTSSGEEIYSVVKPALENIEEISTLFEKIKQMKKGVLRIGTNTSNIALLLSQSLLNYCTKFSDIELKIFRYSEEDLCNKLEKGNLDFVFIDSNNIPNNFKILKSFTVDYSIICDTNRFLNCKKIITLNDIENLDFVLINNTYTSRRNIDDYFKRQNIKMKATYEVDSYTMVVQMVKLGLGYGIVNAEYFKNEIANKEINVVNTNFKIDGRKFVFGINTKNKLSIAAENFTDYLN